MRPRSCLALLPALILSACGSNSRCEDPKGSQCANTKAYAESDPRSVCHVCCETTSRSSDATAEISQSDVASGQFRAHVLQQRPFGADLSFIHVQATWNPDLFSGQGAFNFDDNSGGLVFHLLTRGRQNEGNVAVIDPAGFAVISTGFLNCNLARN